MALSRISFVAAILFWSHFASAQINRYMVFFKDKTGTPHAVGNPSTFLSPKAIERRNKQGILATAQDLPVNPAYVAGLRNAGAQVFHKTRWMNGVLVQCDVSLIASIQALPFVNNVEFVAPGTRLVSSGRVKGHSRTKNGMTGEKTLTQLSMLGLPKMHSDGYRGEGITIAVFDGGFTGIKSVAAFQHLFDEGRLQESLCFDYVRNSNNVFGYDSHGTNVFSVISAFVPDAFTGGAYKANFQLYITEDGPTEYRVEEYNWLFAAERVDSLGVDVVNSSLGYYDFDLASMTYSLSQMDGKTTVVSRAAQWLSDRGVVVVVSAGNEGNIASWRKITAPADAPGVLAVGNVNASGQRSSSSSMGPTADKRIKPDVAALGSGVSVVTPSGIISTSSGTSLSSPLIASLAAVVWQRYPEKTSKEVIELIKSAGSRASNPDTLIGYGIPYYDAIVGTEQRNEKNLFAVYPNPVVDTLFIEAKHLSAIGEFEIQLISNRGQMLLQRKLRISTSNELLNIDISDLSPGVFFVRIFKEGSVYSYKLIKSE